MLRFFTAAFLLLLFPLSAFAQFYPGGMGNTNMVFWLQPDNGLHTVNTAPFPPPTVGNDVQVWFDRTPNGNDIQGFGNRPSFFSPSIHGGGAARFDEGNNEGLSMNNANEINDAAHNAKRLSLLFRPNRVNLNAQMIYEEGGGTNGLSIYLRDDVLYVATWNYGATDWDTPPYQGQGVFVGEDYRCLTMPGIVAGQDYLVTLHYDNLLIQNPGLLRGYVNGAPMSVDDGVSVKTELPVNTLDAHGGAIGFGVVNANSKYFDLTTGNDNNPNTGDYFDGDLGEFVYYNGVEAASDARRVIVENYFSTEYQFPLAQGDYYPEDPVFRNQMIGIGRESITDFWAGNVQSSGGMFMQNVNFLLSQDDYIFAAHNAGTGATPDGLGEYANREWFVFVTDALNSDGQVELCFDLGQLGIIPTCAADLNDYYLRVNDVVTNLGAGSYDAVTNQLCFTVQASTIHNSRVTVGTQDVGPVVEAGNCNDGCDNDGDGLIDCFDPDCNGNSATPDPACDDFLFGRPPPDCELEPDTTSIVELELEFETDQLQFSVEQRGGVFIGDVVPDGTVLGGGFTAPVTAEVVSKQPFDFPYTSGPLNGTPRSPAIFIYNGVDGQMIQEIPTTRTDRFSMLALGDVDRDGLGDIYVTDTDFRLYRYEFDPSIAFGGSQPANNWLGRSANNAFRSTENSPALADFNGDGVAEVYVGNAIFNGLTCDVIVPYDNAKSSGFHENDDWSVYNAAFPVAYDFFAPGDPLPGGGNCGGECAGLELVTGDVVYAVDLAGGTLIPVANAPAGIPDGRVSIADMDNDSHPDIITVGRIDNNTSGVFIWNPTAANYGQMGATFPLPGYTAPGTGAVGTPNTTTRVGGRANIADMDGDGRAEIALGGHCIFMVIDVEDTNNDGAIDNISLLWQRHIDETSERTSGSTFDFNGDGIAEAIYSDENSLFVWRGSDGLELSKEVAFSGTRSEYPLVADLDKDDQTELIITTQDITGPDDNAVGWVRVYRSASLPWVPSRPVWHQHTYHITNVEDDLTIPAFQQIHTRPGYIAGPPSQMSPINLFNCQSGIFDTDNSFLFPAPDLQVIDLVPAFDQLSNYDPCDPNTGILPVYVTIRNTGDANLPRETLLSFYDGNPFTTDSTAVTLDVSPIDTVVAPGTDVTILLDINITSGGYQLNVLGNIDGFLIPPRYDANNDTIYDQGECDFSNNLQASELDPCRLLPVELRYFTAENFPEHVQVRWETVTEKNSAYFIVERAGAEGEFVPIGQVQAAGTTQERHTYTFLDREPLTGWAYYRLRQVDLDGKQHFSPAVPILRQVNVEERLWPNPVSQGDWLNVGGKFNAEAVESALLISPLGQQLHSVEVQRSAEGLKISTKNLPRGLYLLKLQDRGQTQTHKFVVE